MPSRLWGYEVGQQTNLLRLNCCPDAQHTQARRDDKTFRIIDQLMISNPYIVMVAHISQRVETCCLGS